jgi:uncharacterized protein (TIGR03435 family)
MQSLKLPKWTSTEYFDIQARAVGSPTKDQLRLMMQSLLAERFRLAIHNETRQLPVFALVLVKSGKTGPHLQAHAADDSCPTVFPPEAAWLGGNRSWRVPGLLWGAHKNAC